MRACKILFLLEQYEYAQQYQYAHCNQSYSHTCTYLYMVTCFFWNWLRSSHHRDMFRTSKQCSCIQLSPTNLYTSQAALNSHTTTPTRDHCCTLTLRASCPGQTGNGVLRFLDTTDRGHKTAYYTEEAAGHMASSTSTA